jgi:hypothetical protein
MHSLSCSGHSLSYHKSHQNTDLGDGCLCINYYALFVAGGSMNYGATGNRSIQRGIGTAFI